MKKPGTPGFLLFAPPNPRKCLYAANVSREIAPVTFATPANGA
jgi:hypothetical protein